MRCLFKPALTRPDLPPSLRSGPVWSLTGHVQLLIDSLPCGSGFECVQSLLLEFHNGCVGLRKVTGVCSIVTDSVRNITL